MATQQTTGGEQQQRGGMEGDVGSPLSNDAFNIIAALHKKLEGLEAMRKYSKDGDLPVWKELSKLDQQAVMRLVDQLEEMCKSGRLRGAMQQPKPTAKG